MRTLLHAPTPLNVLDDGTRVLVRPAGRRDVAALLSVGDDDPWPTLPLTPPDPADALPGVDGDTAMVLLALDDSGACLGVAGYDRVGGVSSARLAVGVTPRVAGRGAAAKLVRRLAAVAIRYDVRELRGWLSPTEGRELLLAPPPPTCHLLSVAEGRWWLSVRLTGEVDR